MTKGYVARTCACGHRVGDHLSDRARGLTVKFGRCLIEGCDCHVFTEQPEVDRMSVIERKWTITRRISDTASGVSEWHVAEGPDPGPSPDGIEVVPLTDYRGAVDRVAELEAEVERLKREYMAGHRDGYLEGSTSVLADPGGQ